MRQKIRSASATAAIVTAAVVLGTAAGQALARAQDAAPGDSEPTRDAANPWSQFSYEGAFEVETYDGLRGTVRSASVSVLGTVTDVRPGEVLVDSDGKEAMRYQSIVVSVAVDDVLSGTVADSVDVEFGPFAEEDLASTSLDDLTGQQSIFLLRLKGSGVESEGIAPDPSVMKRTIFRVVNSTGLLDDASRVVDAPLDDKFQGVVSGRRRSVSVGRVRR